MHINGIFRQSSVGPNDPCNIQQRPSTPKISAITFVDHIKLAFMSELWLSKKFGTRILTANTTAHRIIDVSGEYSTSVYIYENRTKNIALQELPIFIYALKYTHHFFIVPVNLNIFRKQNKMGTTPISCSKMYSPNTGMAWTILKSPLNVDKIPISWFALHNCRSLSISRSSVLNFINISLAAFVSPFRHKYRGDSGIKKNVIHNNSDVIAGNRLMIRAALNKPIFWGAKIKKNIQNL